MGLTPLGSMPSAFPADLNGIPVSHAAGAGQQAAQRHGPSEHVYGVLTRRCFILRNFIMSLCFRDRLRRCGVAAAVLRAARHRHMRVCESALRAVVALARLDQEPEQGRPTSATAAGAAAGAAPSSSSGGGGGGGGKGGASPRGPPPGFGGGKPQGAAANGGGGTAAAAAAAPSLRAQLVDAGALGVLQSLQVRAGVGVGPGGRDGGLSQV